MRKIRTVTAAALVAATAALTGCSSAADTVSSNISQDADSFHIERRIVFYNGITGAYILEVEGLCSLGNDDPAGKLSVTCKTGPNAYKKHFLGLSDNVTYFAEQTEASREDAYHYKVIFRPQEIVPDINVQVGGK